MDVRRQEEGFTVLELVIVIMSLAILVSLVLLFGG